MPPIGLQEWPHDSSHEAVPITMAYPSPEAIQEALDLYTTRVGSGHGTDDNHGAQSHDVSESD